MPAPSSLPELRAFASTVAATLFTKNKQIAAVLDLVTRAASVEEVERGVRGFLEKQPVPTPAAILGEMSLPERVRLAMVPPSTNVLRFETGERKRLEDTLRACKQAGRVARILCVPCATGEEAFSIALYARRWGSPAQVDAFDVQPALIAFARTGVLTFQFDDVLERPAVLRREFVDSVRFAVADVTAESGPAPASSNARSASGGRDGERGPVPASSNARSASGGRDGERGPDALPEGEWDVVLCRYLLPYLDRDVAASVARRLATRVAAGGILMLDPWVFDVMATPIVDAVTAAGLRRVSPASTTFVR